MIEAFLASDSHDRSVDITDDDRRPVMTTSPAPEGASSDNGQLSSEARSRLALSQPRKRSKVERETPAFRKMLLRQFDAYERRVGGSGDIEELPGMVDLHRELDERIARAARALHDHHGYSWGDIAKRMNTSRQAARQRGDGDEHHPSRSDHITLGPNLGHNRPQLLTIRIRRL